VHSDGDRVRERALVERGQFARRFQQPHSLDAQAVVLEDEQIALGAESHVNRTGQSTAGVAGVRHAGDHFNGLEGRDPVDDLLVEDVNGVVNGVDAQDGRPVEAHLGYGVGRVAGHWSVGCVWRAVCADECPDKAVGRDRLEPVGVDEVDDIVLVKGETSRRLAVAALVETEGTARLGILFWTGVLVVEAFDLEELLMDWIEHK